MTVDRELTSEARKEVRRRIQHALRSDGVALLPPMDVHDALWLSREAGFSSPCVMLDPWYNKGVGGVRDDYDDFIRDLLDHAAGVAEHVYLWGFPEIIARYVDRLPNELKLTAWLTWYYKNNPSVIRGWRSSQMTCLHLSREGARLYPEHFLNEKQLALQSQGKLRYMPGPPSVLEGPTDVIEAPLLVGFVGKKEQTGHKAQKPQAVYEKLLMMVLAPGDVVIDPMCGSGTCGAAALRLGSTAILSDHDELCVEMVEHRLGIKRLSLPVTFTAEAAS